MDYETTRSEETEVDALNFGPATTSMAQTVAHTGAVTLLPDADNVVVLPAGASLDDITVRGRDLIVTLADGQTFVIPDGAIFVPVIVIEGVAVPPLNLAAYLNSDQPQPAAGAVQSSGGNFADPSAPIQAAYGLGDLLPYTELVFPLAQDEEVLPGLLNNTPAITFVPQIGEGTEVSEAGLPPTTITRTNESQGSAFDGDAVSTSGVVTFNSLDGVGGISVNGVTLDPALFPQIVVSNATGTLIVTAVTFDPTSGNGTISYTYTLNDNTSATDGSQVVVPISVTDQDGETASDTLVIRIVDDVPTAFPNTNSVIEGGSVAGNVVTDQTDDIFGADGPASTSPAGGVVGVRAANGDTTTSVSSGTGTQIQGQFGTLTLSADGSYVYVAKSDITNQDVEDVFVYTIRDGDGDQSTTTLTITLDDVSGTLSDNDAIVDESGLDGIGSQIVPDGEFFTGGQITVTGATGPFLYQLTSPANGAYGNLALDAVTGAYSYTLDTPFDGADNNNGRNTIEDGESFGYRVTDQNGNVIGSGTITIDIVDDVPSASADFNTVTEGGTATGNVLPNDIFGADGAVATSPAGGVIGVRAADGDIVTAVTTGTGTQIQGEHGVLTLGANGNYSYKADANIPQNGVVDVFVYTIEDGDGDRSTTTLTITVQDIIAQIADNDPIVDESGLDGIGSQIVPDGEFFTGGQITVTGATGPFIYTLISPADGAYGQLTLNSATGAYTYELDTVFDGSTVDNGRDTISGAESFAYRVTDQAGNEIGTGSITVDIVDDVPTAFPNSNVVVEGGAVQGNVLTDQIPDEFGADSAAVTNPLGGVIGVRAANGDTTTVVTSGTGTQIDGLFGTLTLNANGTYSYLANDIAGNADVTDVFVYSIEDGDGDRSTTTLTITVAADDVPPPPLETSPRGGDSVSLEVDEAALDLVDDPADIAAGSVTGSNPQLGTETDIEVNALTFTAGTDPFTSIAFAAGQTPTVSGLAPGYSITWALNGGILTGTLHDVNGSLGEVIKLTLSGNTGPFVSEGVTDVTVTATLVGRLEHLNPNGPQGPVTINGITVVTAESDGQSVVGLVNVTVTDDLPQVDIAIARGFLTVDESEGLDGSTKDESGANPDDETAGAAPIGATGFATGSLVASASFDAGADGETARSFSLSVVDGSDSGLVDTVSGQSVTLSINNDTVEGKAGDALVFTIAVDANGNGTLVQYRAVSHDNDVDNDQVSDNDHDQNDSPAMLAEGTITLIASLTDGDGDVASQSIDVSGLFRFEDDGPAAADESVTVNEGSVINGLLDFDPGEDGGSVTHINGVPLVFDAADGGYSNPIDLDQGVLKVKADGSFSFTAGGNGDSAESATFTVTDGDGDTVEATINIRVVDANSPVGADAKAQVDDDGLLGGNPNDPASDLDANPGDVNETVFTGTLGYGFGGDGAHPTEPVIFANGNGQVGIESVSYSWSGDTLTATITSGPRINQDLFTVKVDNPATGSYTVTLLRNVLHADGNSENDAGITLNYTVKDGDGSTAPGTLAITFDDDTPTASALVGGNVEEGDVETGMLTFVPGADGASVTHIGNTALVFGQDGFSQSVSIGAGSIRVQADGDYEFTAGSNSVNGGIASTTFTVTDGDGDPVTANIDFTVTDGNFPTGASAQAAVDDDGLLGGNPNDPASDLDANPGDVNETVFTGTLGYGFGGDGAHPTEPVIFANGNGQVGIESVSYSWSGDTLTATITSGPRINQDLFTVKVDNPATGSYTVTLLRNVLHADGNSENDAGITLNYTVKDGDGSTAPGTLAITFDDDTPTASALVGGNVEEGDVETGMLTFVPGADGASVTHIGNTALVFGQDGFSQSVSIGAGSIRVQADGDYEFTAGSNSVNGGIASTTFTVTDGDGDPVTANIDFTVTDGNFPTGASAQAAVDDDGLLGGNPNDPASDLDANPGDVNETVFTGTLGYSFGGDGAHPTEPVIFANGNGQVGIESVSYSWSGDTLTATITSGPRINQDLFTVKVDNPATGSYTVTLLRNVLHADGNSENDAGITLNYTVKDGDGSTAPGTLAITFDDDTPTVTPVTENEPTLVVDETALNINAGPTSFAGAFTIVPGADGVPPSNITYTLGFNPGTTGLVDTITNQAVVLSLVAGQIIGKAGDNSGPIVFIVSVDASGQVSLDQQRAVVHSPNTGPNQSVTLNADNLITLTTSVTDGDGDTASGTLNIGGNLTFLDDIGVLGAFDPATLPNAVGSVNGTFDYDPGADTHGSFAITGPVLAGVSYSTTQNANGTLLTATASGNTTLYTLQVNADGTYSFTLVTPNAGSTETLDLTGLNSGGPQLFLETPDLKIEFSSATGGVNVSGQGFGVSNNRVNATESFTIEFHDPGAVGDQPANVNPNLVNSTTLTVSDVTQSLEVDIFVYNDVTNQVEQVYNNLNVTAGTIVIDPITMSQFNRIFVVGDGGTAKEGQGARFTALSYSKAILPPDVNLEFQITATDKDNDTTSSSTLTVFVDATPVVLDLDGDGAEFISRGAGAAFDYDGNGVAEATAWAGADDGILVHDFQGDGVVTEAAEFVFGDATRTDMEALAARYGETLDANDADFARFGVWQDANGDGISQAGEFKSLTDMGIASIGLKSDGQGYSAANGDVTVHGQSAYVRADGSTGIAADAAFAVGNERIAIRAQEIAATSVAAGVLVAALVEAEAPLTVAAPGHDVSEIESAASASVTMVDMQSYGDHVPIYDAVTTDLASPAGLKLQGSSSTGHQDQMGPDADLGEVGIGSATSAGGDQSVETNDGNSESLITATDSGNELMQGLLLLAEAPASPEEATSGDLGAVREAFVDTQAEDFVDGLVNQFGDGSEATGSGGAEGDLAALLAADIGFDHGFLPGALDFTQTTEEAQALAAAA